MEGSPRNLVLPSLGDSIGDLSLAGAPRKGFSPPGPERQEIAVARPSHKPSPAIRQMSKVNTRVAGKQTTSSLWVSVLLIGLNTLAAPKQGTNAKHTPRNLLRVIAAHINTDASSLGYLGPSK